jgi:hypothetical protein
LVVILARRILSATTQGAPTAAANPLLERLGPWLVALLQASIVARMVSVRELLGSGPIRGGDFTAHYYQAVHASEHLRRSGSVWGYDPYWMAGYAEGLISLIDNKLFLLVLAAVPASAHAAVFNATIVSMMLAVPPLGYWAGRLAGGSRTEATCVALAGVVATFSVPLVVFFWAGGAISFFFAAVLVVPVSLGLLKAVEDETWVSLRWLEWSGAAMATVVIHPAILPALAAAVSPSLAMPRGGRARTVVKLAVLSIAVAIPVWWAISAMRYATNAAPLGSFAHYEKTDFLQGGRMRMWDDWVGHMLRTEGGWSGGAGGLLPLAALALASLGAARRGRGRSRLAPWLAAAACFVLAYGVSRFTLMRFGQPYRFLVPFAFFLCVPAGQGAAACLELIRARSVRAMVVVYMVVLLIGESSMLAKDVVLGAVEDPAEVELAAFFDAADPIGADDGRLLVESLWSQVPAFAGSPRLMTVKRFGLLPLRLGRECLGYGGTGALSPQVYATFGFTRLLGLDLERATRDDLDATLRRYAVSRIVACSAAARAALSRFAGVVEPLREVAGCELLRVARPEPSRLLRGRGRVTAGLDRIEVRDAEGERIVLKYHWIPGLRTDPPLRLEEYRLQRAPVGFVSVYPEGVRDFTVLW